MVEAVCTVSAVLKVCGTHGIAIYIFKNIFIDFICNVLIYVIFFVNASRNCVASMFEYHMVPKGCHSCISLILCVLLTFLESPNHMSRPVIPTQMELPLTYSRNSSKEKGCRAKPNII